MKSFEDENQIFYIRLNPYKTADNKNLAISNIAVLDFKKIEILSLEA